MGTLQVGPPKIPEKGWLSGPSVTFVISGLLMPTRNFGRKMCNSQERHNCPWCRRSGRVPQHSAPAFLALD